jgi:hypothetical protein
MLHEDRVSLDRYIDGTAHRPFCYRVLVPMLLRVMSPVISKLPGIDHVIAICGDFSTIPAKHPASIAGLAVILIFSLVAYSFLCGHIYHKFFSESPYASSIGSVGALVFLVPFVLMRFGHVYDFSVLMFHAAMLLCIAQKRLPLYLAFFTVSCLNKETAILMTVAYAACLYDCIPRRRFVVYLLLQLAIFLLTYGLVHRYFRNNAGGSMEFWLYKQVPVFLLHWKRETTVTLAIVFLVAYRWSEKPPIFRRAMVMLLPHLALYLCGANPGEVRNLYESMPLLALFSIRTIEIIAGHFFDRVFESRRYSAPSR